jgi:hypothetical protein
MCRRLRWPLSLLIVGVTVTTTGSPSNGAEKSRLSAHSLDAEGTSLRRKIIAAIRDNYQRIPVARCKMICTILNPDITERKVIRRHAGGGVTDTAVVAPRFTIEMDVLFSGRNVRVDSVEKETGERRSSAMHDEIWTDYSPSQQWAARWRRENMGGVMNVDPRNLGASEGKKFFLDELAGDRVVRHETVKTERGERLVLNMERDFASSRIVFTYRCEFDLRRNYLLCRLVRYDTDDGKVLSVQDIEYQEVIQNSVWFPKKSTERFFGKVPAGKPEQDGWTQQTTLELSAVQTDETIVDRAFNIEIAPGIRLRDNVGAIARGTVKVNESWESHETTPAAESPALKRILTAWKARQQRLKSFHFTWGSRFSLPKGARDANRKNANEVRFDIPDSECWIEGENRVRAEFRRIDARPGIVQLGKRCRGTLDGSADVTLEFSESKGGSPRGTVWNDKRDHESRASLLCPLLLACRPATQKATGAHPEFFHVLTENAIINNTHCIKIEKNGSGGDRIAETCWVDPSRDYVIVRWEIGRRNSPLFWASIDYLDDSEHGWLPSGWETNLWEVAAQPNGGLIRATVRKYSVNETFSPDTFATNFPPDTILPDPPPRPAKN